MTACQLLWGGVYHHVEREASRFITSTLTRYLNSAFDVTQADYSSLGRLMITVGALGLVPLLALPLLKRQEHHL